MVRTYSSGTDTRDVKHADHRQLAQEHLSHLGVVLELRCREQNTVDAPFHQQTKVAFAVGPCLVKIPDDHTLPLATGFSLSSDHKLSQDVVAKVAGDYPYRPGSLADETACQGVWDIVQLFRNLQNPGPGFLRDGAFAL